ncbi:MAG: cyclic nucleotide-binding domain-containing protein [Acidobacteria bacterium]|nr:cyclic nucleotide-binding domain-containing protein [Acidobacteriota bacterium]MCA1642500.1 cyclic nucleotide-binding domain-containing protein [Acidobacteriota bacterium]
MPREIKTHKTVLEAIGRAGIISELVEREGGHYKYELDLEVIAYGRNYNGKKVGPYVRLLEFAPGEEIIRQGDWGGNTFYVTVEGTLDVLVAGDDGEAKKVAELPAGVSFGEMSVLAGVPRNATIVAPARSQATVIEITRPALRLLRKLPKFGRALDATYRSHGLARMLLDVRDATGEAFDDELLKSLGDAARFVVYGRGHVLHAEGEPVERVVLIRDGWVRRVRGLSISPASTDVAHALDGDAGADFLGAGNCLGLEGVEREARWQYTATVMARTEALEISVAHLRGDPRLREAVASRFSEFSLADDDISLERVQALPALAAAEKEITTGIIDGANLLVMDMDLCVRCGNCSLACHKVHGKSRLLRRGIHVERPLRAGGEADQHVLAPQVCLHCKDPECLTGCPTGAIARFEDGQIDIDPKTCIGCGDCAVQCPYAAISMVSRKSPAAAPPTWSERARVWLSLAQPELPAPVTETDNLLAVKCNLCNNTPLNRPGARRQAYSCQENCPTGALVRVNPREYFDEVGSRLGLVFQDQTHAIGRNIHKRDPLARLWHALGVAATLAVTLATLWLLSLHGLDGRIGGTWLSVRWITGLAGLLGIAAAMTYPARKQVYRRRAGALRYWMLAHVYAGAAAGLLLLMHGGRSTGGLLTTVLMISFDLTILTGLFGLTTYLVVPRVMTGIEGEPLLLEDLRVRREELRASLAQAAHAASPALRDLLRGRVRRRYLSLGFLLRQFARREELSSLQAAARAETESDASLLPDAESRRLLYESVDALVTLRRVDALIYLHQLLKLWLAPHVVSTSLMLALMLAHVAQVVFFAAR